MQLHWQLPAFLGGLPEASHFVRVDSAPRFVPLTCWFSRRSAGIMLKLSNTVVSKLLSHQPVLVAGVVIATGGYLT